MLIKNKFGQMGDTITWIVATIVIVVILLFFLFGASLLGSTKNLGSFKESLTSESIFKGDDIFLKKSIYTYYSLDSSSNKLKINMSLAEREKKGEFRLPLEETKKQILINLNKK